MKFSISARLETAKKLKSLASAVVPFAAAFVVALNVQAASAQPLTFQMTARFKYRDSPEQTVESKFWVKDRRVRIESQVGGRPMVVLYTPPFAYRLLPTSRTGLRYSADALPNVMQSVFGSRELLPNPGSIRAALQKYGASRVGTVRMNGQVVDIYYSANYKGKGHKVRAWIRRSDALPMRMISNSPQLSVVASWRNYRRVALADSLFSVPPGYRVRVAQ